MFKLVLLECIKYSNHIDKNVKNDYNYILFSRRSTLNLIIQVGISSTNDEVQNVRIVYKQK